MRIIIAAAGSQKKWGSYLNVPSHLAPLRRPIAEPLLKRTVRQALSYTDDVHLTSPDDMRYVFPGVMTHVKPVGRNEYDSTRPFWLKDGRTVLLLGDVFFSGAAMETICVYEEPRFHIFGRSGGSRVTGTTWGEIFAASWWPDDFETLEEHLQIVAKARRDGSCITPADGWALLRSLQGTPLNNHRVLPGWLTEINDWTDDFDFPADYLRHPATRR